MTMPTYLCNDGNEELEIKADSAEAAAQEYVDGGNWGDEPSTVWVDVYVREIDEDENEVRDHGCITITVDPEVPACDKDNDHDWQSPYDVIGGLKDNPGVWGKGAGTITKEVCAHCGQYKITDTWAQNPENGEQGLTSVRYEDADERSSEWARDHRISTLRVKVERVLESMDAVTSYRDGDNDDEITMINGLREGVYIGDVISELEDALGDAVYIRDLDPTMPGDGKPDLIAIETP